MQHVGYNGLRRHGPVHKLGVVFLTLLASSTYAAPSGVRYVRADAKPGGDGLSWATAYNDLHQALVAVVGSGGTANELWVMHGTYRPGPLGSADRTRTFTLSSGVGLYGGFAGDETDRDQRDPAANTTILTGDIGDGTFVYNVVTVAGTSATVLDGFTVRDGLADGPSADPSGAGGGLRITGAPVIRNCRITANSCGRYLEWSDANVGAGVYCAPGSSPTFIDCAIANNAGLLAIGGTAGGGAGIALQGASIHLIRCVIRDNHAGDGVYGPCAGTIPTGPGNAGSGGGIHAQFSSVLLENCIVAGNSSGGGGQGVVCDGGLSTAGPGLDASNGGGVYCANSVFVAVNTLFVGNKAGDGGAALAPSGSGAAGGDGGNGGGVYANNGETLLVNCTLADNAIGQGAPGGLHGDDGTPGVGSGIRASGASHLENCIVWDDGLDEVVGPTTAYCDIRGRLLAGPGNISADPRFIDPAGGDYRLSIASPCIDSANSFADINPAAPGTQPLPEVDLEGLGRRDDIVVVIDTGIGAPIVDMGAYELQGCAADFNGDGLIDFTDYCEFLRFFDSLDSRADLTGDGMFDFSDYLEFLNYYDAGC